MNFMTKLLQCIGFLPTIITSVESWLSGKSGNDKKNAALSFLESALSLTDAIANQQIVDEPAFRTGLEQIINGTVACLNASIWASRAKTAAPNSKVV